MKILQVHNRYKITGGEWSVLCQEYELLRRHHQVDQFIVENSKELSSAWNKFKLIFNTHYNKKARKDVKEKLLKRRSNIMHVHNFFPLLSPSIFDASSEAGVPSVLTLHNYRLIHPNGYMLYNGKIDERGLNGSAYRCVSDGVYRNSVLQTAVVAHMIEYHRRKKTWQTKVDRFICLTDFSKSQFVKAGIPENRIVVKPNFVHDHFEDRQRNRHAHSNASYYLFIGRISEEKGVRTLVSAWQQIAKKNGPKLVLLGDGPLKKEMMALSQSNPQIEWLGYVQQRRVLDYLGSAKALIFPSEWYEGMPMTILESFSAGIPVITSDIGSQAEIVTHNQTGYHFETGNKRSLVQAIEKFENDHDFIHFLGKKARKEYEEKYSPEVNYSQLLSLYKNL